MPRTVVSRFELRTDTAANWTSVNPVLREGEPGFEVDTNKLKIGDGAKTWSALSYLVSSGGGGGGSTDWGDILGTLSNQTDLATALAGKQPVGSYLVSSDLAPYATTASLSAYATVASLSSYLTTAAAAAAYQPLASVLTNTTASFTTAQQTKLAGIATGATANDTDANLKNRANHTGTQSADTITDGTTNKAFLATERTKLSGIATGATANDTDANLKNRANHTGTQLASTISDFNTAADARLTRGLSIFCSGVPANNEVIGGGIAPYSFTIVQANCSAKSLVAATASTTITLKNNGSSIGTVVFGIGSTTGTVTITTAAVTAGDNITAHGPATADATLADITILIKS
jgi:hypothetical protein